MSRVSTAPDAPAPASYAGSRVNRAALAVALAVGHAIGLLPICFLVSGPTIARRALAIGTVLTVLIVMVRRTATMSTALPRPKHFVMAAAGGAFYGCVTGYMWLGVHYSLAALIGLLRAVVGWPDVPDVFATVWKYSLYVAIPFFAGSLTLGMRELTPQLYPDRAGVEPVFETASLSRREIWHFTGIVLAAGIIVFAALALGYGMPAWLAIILMFTVLMASAPLATLSTGDRRPGLREVIDATKRALESAGCEVLPAPRTGDPSVDPLLADLSLYVRAPGRRHAFAIDIKASSTGQPLDWSAASTLALKVSALTNIESRDSDGDAIQTITPVLVALTPADDSLREFAQDHRVTLLESVGDGYTTAAEATSDNAGNVVLSNAVVRSAVQNVPALIRALIEQSEVRSGGGAVAPVS